MQEAKVIISILADINKYLKKKKDDYWYHFRI